MGIATDQRPPKKDLSEVEKLIRLHLRKGATSKELTWVLLGGKSFMPKPPTSNLDFWTAGIQGIRRDAINRLAEVLEVPMTEMAALLHISYKTLTRKQNNELLDNLLSSLCIEITETIANGLLVFEDRERLNRWLRKENRALQQQRPIDLLRNPTGIRMINAVLHRIEEGIHT